MRYLVGLMTLIFSIHVYSETMVFLVEQGDSKQVGISTKVGEYKLLTSGPDWHLYPTVSTDAKKVAYVQGKDQDSLKLTVMDLLTKETKTLTKGGFILHPQFAKNDTTLYFSEKINGTNQIGFLDINNPSKITYINEKFNSFFPAPLQAGELVVYQRNAAVKEIVLYEARSQDKKVIGNGMSPAVSKDEKYIAYTAKVDGNWDIYIYDRFTEKTVRATTDMGRDFSPQFDRFGNLIYTSDKAENGVFSVYKKTVNDWQNTRAANSIVMTLTGTSFYAPRISGLAEYKIDILTHMPGEPRSSFGTINHNGVIYVMGGHQGPEHTYPPESFTGRVTAYDTKTRTWSVKAPRPTPCHGFQLASHGKYIYAFGGFAYDENNTPKWKSISTVERYNTENNTWDEVQSMPRKRSSNIVAKVGHKAYMIGGWDSTPKYVDDIDGTFHAEIDVFNFDTETWITIASTLPKKRRAFSAFVKEGQVYLVGGISEGGSHFSLLNDFTKFDPLTLTFRELPKLPFATFAPASNYLGEKAYIFGGMFKTGDWNYEYVPHIYEFDFSTGNWSHSGRYLHGQKGFSQVVRQQNCLGVLGGHTYDGATDKPTDVYELFCSR